MKKKFIYVFVLFILLVPMCVKAEEGKTYYTSVLKNEIEIDEDLEYVVEANSPFGSTSGVHSTFYVEYDSNKIEYVDISEYETKTNTKFDAKIEKDGVLKVTYTATNDFNENFNVKILINFKAVSEDVSGLVTLKIIPNYIYEKLTCIDCEGFWLGEVVKGNEERTVTFINNNIEEKENNDIASIDDDIKSKDMEKDKSCNRDLIMYISLGLNVILLVVLMISLLKKKREL